MILHQDLGERLPHVAVVAEAVQQHHGGAGTSDADTLCAVADRNLLGMKGGRPRLDLGLRRCRGEPRQSRKGGGGAANF